MGTGSAGARSRSWRATRKLEKVPPPHKVPLRKKIAPQWKVAPPRKVSA